MQESRSSPYRCGGWKDRDLEGAVGIYDDPADILANSRSSLSLTTHLCSFCWLNTERFLDFMHTIESSPNIRQDVLIPDMLDKLCLMKEPRWLLPGAARSNVLPSDGTDRQDVPEHAGP